MMITKIALSVGIAAIILTMVFVPIYPINESFQVEQKKEVPFEYAVRESYITSIWIGS